MEVGYTESYQELLNDVDLLPTHRGLRQWNPSSLPDEGEVEPLLQNTSAIRQGLLKVWKCRGLQTSRYRPERLLF